MTRALSNFSNHAVNYLRRLETAFTPQILCKVEELAIELLNAWGQRRQVFICGNGGSAANAIHMANDFHYGIGSSGFGAALPGLRVEALPANVGVITCLANDIGYEDIYAHQLEVKSSPGDLLIALSGSGNSPNIVRALESAKCLQVKTTAILAYTGGHCLDIADTAIHFPIDDMQIAEDCQLIVGHLCMQWLSDNKLKRELQ